MIKTRKMLNKTVNFFLSFIILFIYSCGKKEKIDYYSDGSPNYIYEYSDPKDTSSYKFTSFYPNAIMKESGNVVNSKRDGAWIEYYSDGNYRRTIYYKDGIPDISYKGRKYPSVQFMSDSLKVGKATNVRVQDLYQSEILGCIGGKIISSTLKDDFDFIIIPDMKDSLSILYIDPLVQNIDTVKITKYQTDELLKYGIKEDDFHDNDSITIISKKNKQSKLITLPVYE